MDMNIKTEEFQEPLFTSVKNEPVTKSEVFEENPDNFDGSQDFSGERKSYDGGTIKTEPSAAIDVYDGLKGYGETQIKKDPDDIQMSETNETSITKDSEDYDQISENTETHHDDGNLSEKVFMDPSSAFYQVSAIGSYAQDGCHPQFQNPNRASTVALSAMVANEQNKDAAINGDNVNNTVSSGSDTLTCPSSQNPWPYIQDFFEFVSSSKEGDRMIFKCLKCLPKSKCYKAQKKSLFSLRSHIASIHFESLAMFNMCIKKRSREHVKKKRDLSGERDEADYRTVKKRAKQLKIPEAMALGASCHGYFSKEVLEDRIINFFVDNVLSPSIVESDSFIQLMECASARKFSMSRRTLTRKIEEKYKCGVASLKGNLEEPLYVATTTDAWSCWNKSYLGVTVHWIDPHTLLRKKGVIACRQLEGKPTFNALAREIEDINIQFGIQDKTCATTTDNDSNFVKAFSLFGESQSNGKRSQSQGAARPIMLSDSEEEDDADESETIIEDITTILDQDEASNKDGTQGQSFNNYTHNGPSNSGNMESHPSSVSKSHTQRKPTKRRDSGPNICSICQRNFSRNIHLQNHMLIHTGEKPHQCPQCGRMFRLLELLKAHLLTHSGERKYECPQCNKRFTQSNTLSVHLRIHTGERPYPCLQCGKGFCDSSALKSHLRVHSGEKPYECRQCDKKFNSSSHLKTHLLITHKREKPYECSECKKRFGRPSDLRIHFRVHSGEKPYACSQCPKTFARSSTLKKHLRVHSRKNEED